MAFFLPTHVQKRLLRYALSHLELVDTDTLDLEQLDIAWGHRSSVELRNVALRLDKVSELLHLPDSLQLTKGNIISLRVTVPADLHRSGISIEIDGVEIGATVKNIHGKPSEGQHQEVEEDNVIAETSRDGNEDDYSEDPVVPWTRDVAKSFLAEETLDERKELEAAVLAAPTASNLEDSMLSEESDEGFSMGTGVALALPAFLANFLKGVADRLELFVGDVLLTLNFDVSSEDLPSISRLSGDVRASLNLHVREVEIQGLTVGVEELQSPSRSENKRRISLQDVRLDLIAHSSYFAAASSVSSALSPAPTQESLSASRVIESPSIHSAGSAVDAARSTPSPASSRRQQLDSPVGSMSKDHHDSIEAAPTERGDAENDGHGDVQNDDRFADASDDGKSASPIQSTMSSKHSAGSNGSDSPIISRNSQPFPGDSVFDIEPSALRASHFSASPSELLSRGQSADSDPQEGSSYSERPLRGVSARSDRSSSSDSSTSPSTSWRNEDLAESKIFSHEEAASMYMSAMSEAFDQQENAGDNLTPSRSPSSPQTPGNSEGEDLRSETPTPKLSPTEHSTRDIPEESLSYAPEPKVNARDGKYQSTYDSLSTTKSILNANGLSIWLPWAGENPEPLADGHDLQFSVMSTADSFADMDMPGAFSQHHSNKQEAKRKSTQSPSIARNPTGDALPSKEATSDQQEHNIEVDFGDIQCNIDLQTGNLLVLLLGQLFLSTAAPIKTSASKIADDVVRPDPSHHSALFRLQSFRMSLVEHLQGIPVLDQARTTDRAKLGRASDSIINLQFSNSQFQFRKGIRSTAATLQLRNLALETSGEKIISFEAGTEAATKVKSVTPVEPCDILVKYTDEETRGREVHIETLPIILSLNMQRLDETLSSFGGLSALLDLSSSVASNSTILASTPARIVQSQPKAVRFDVSTPTTTAPSTPTIKVNAKIQGLFFKMAGRTCEISARSSAIKLIVREVGASVRVDHIKLTGPRAESSNQPSPLTVDILHTKVDFRFSPDESNLTRLVSLIMPTRNRYEDDEDILLDTLLRQRKKGSLIRVAVSTIDVNITDLSTINQLKTLGDDISKFSGVAKYLPDDERPGILTLLNVDKAQVQLFVSDPVGTIFAESRNFQLATVALPALFALEMGDLVVRRDDEELLHPVLTMQQSDRLPMIMARIIGDEMDPTVKVKLYNLALEYRVPTLMAFMGLEDPAMTEDLTASVVASVATIQGRTSSGGLARQPSITSDGGRSSVSPLHLDLLLKDSAIGLNPNGSNSKALLLLSDARLIANASITEPLKAAFEIRAASVLTVDDTSNIDITAQPAPRSPASKLPSPAVSDLSRQGFQYVASLSAVKIDVEADEGEDGKTSLDVLVSPKLLVLETCADSTQTLIQIIDGLKPPSPPSPTIHYRTDPMPIQDLMASFSGDDFQQLDVEDPDLTINPGAEDINIDDLPVDFDLVESFYGHGSPGYEYVPSSLSGPSTATFDRVRPRNHRLSATLKSPFDSPPDGPPPRIFDNHLTKMSRQGAGRGWDSVANRYGIVPREQIVQCPLHVRVRAGTVLWNLHDGYDWQKTREVISEAVEKVQVRAAKRRIERQTRTEDVDDEESEVGDFLFQSIWITVPPNKDERDLRSQINHEVDDLVSESGTATNTGGDIRSTSRNPHQHSKSKSLKLSRSKRQKLSIELRDVSIDLLVLPAGSGETQSSIDVRIGEFDVFDHVPTSTWKKFATYMHDAGIREMNKPMVHLAVLNVKPVQELAASELVLLVTVLPLRLHVDQDTLDFVTRFFEFKDKSKAAASSPIDPPFIQRIEVKEVMLKLDYKPKKVDYVGLRSGHTSEFMNFVILDGADIILRRTILYGVSGFDRLHKDLNNIWIPDVTRNQLPGVLAGLAPVRPLVDVGRGIRNLVVVPMQEYRKDGRLVRSIQKGAVAFARTTTSELARLGAKVAIGTQNILQGTETFLSPSNNQPGALQTYGDWDEGEISGSPGRRADARAVSNYADQPLTVVSGIRSAARSLEEDLLSARDAIIAVGTEIRESDSATDVAKAVIRHAPAVILKPAIGTTKAIGTALLGAGNALDKDSRRKVEDKYKRF